MEKCSVGFGWDERGGYTQSEYYERSLGSHWINTGEHFCYCYGYCQCIYWNFSLFLVFIKLIVDNSSIILVLSACDWGSASDYYYLRIRQLFVDYFRIVLCHTKKTFFFKFFFSARHFFIFNENFAALLGFGVILILSPILIKYWTHFECKSENNS